MKVAGLVSKFLKSEDRVIIPGLGAFMPRQFNEDSSLASSNPIKGEKQDIIFSTFLTVDDMFLVNQLAKTEGISVSEAQGKVDLFVTYCKEELAIGKRIFFDKLGWLYKDVDGEIKFDEMDGLDAFQAQIEKEKEQALLQKTKQTNISLQQPPNHPKISPPHQSYSTSARSESTNVMPQPKEQKKQVETSDQEKNIQRQTPQKSTVIVPKSTIQPANIAKDKTTSILTKKEGASRMKNNNQKSNNFSESPQSTANSKVPIQEKVEQNQVNMENNNPYTEEVQNENKKSYSLIITIALAFVIIAAGVAFFMTGASGEEEEEELSYEETIAMMNGGTVSASTTTLDEAKIEKEKEEVTLADASVKEESPTTKKVEVEKSTPAVVKVVEPVVKKAAPAQVKKQKAQKNIVSSVSSSGNYFIIAASVKKSNQAEKIAENLRGKGYKPFIVPINSKGNIRVSYGRWSDKNDALDQLSSIRTQENKDAWLVKLNVK